jgi:hypothetical protein
MSEKIKLNTYSFRIIEFIKFALRLDKYYISDIPDNISILRGNGHTNVSVFIDLIH